MAGSEEKMAGSEEKVAGSEKKMAGSEGKMAGSEKKMAGSEEKMAGSEEKMAGSEEKMAGSEKKMAGSEEKMAGSEKKMAGSGKKMLSRSQAPAWERELSKKLRFASLQSWSFASNGVPKLELGNEKGRSLGTRKAGAWERERFSNLISADLPLFRSLPLQGGGQEGDGGVFAPELTPSPPQPSP